MAKVRSIADDLRELDNQVHADDILGQLKAAREDGVRALRDASELADGDGVVKFGPHRFAVNRQALALSLLMRDDEPYITLSGSDFAEPVHDENSWKRARIGSKPWSVKMIRYIAQNIWPGNYYRKRWLKIV